MVTSPLICLTSVLLFYFLGLVVKPSPWRQLLMVPIIVAIVSFFGSGLEYQTFSEYTLACILLVLFFSASDYILLTDVQQELFEKGQKVPAYQLPLFERVQWAARLFIGNRCVDWSHEPTHVLPPRPSPATTRPRFVLNQLLYLALELAIFEALTTYTKSSPCFAANGHSMAADGVFWLAVNLIVYGISASVSIDMPHRVLGIVVVGSGFKEPRDWVPFFGSVYDAYSLRNFWGRVWHQMLRRQMLSHGRFLAYRVLRLKKGSLASFLVQMYVGFAISALIHFGGEYSVLGRWSCQHAVRFFFLQAIGVSVETVVFEIGKKLSIRGSWYWVGYLWVLGWFMYTFPGWMDPLFRAGMIEMTSNFGILASWLKREWA
ncbi:Membrane bound O-acyl transferase family domain containing protein [Amanita muscaria]